MEFTWKLSRYSRFYSDFQKQSFDKDSTISLFPFFSQSTSQLHSQKLEKSSQIVNTGIWSTICSSKNLSLELHLRVISERVLEMDITMKISYDAWEIEAASQKKSQSEALRLNPILLERLKFPEAFEQEFKASPKTECIGFRYISAAREQFCFQVDFESAFSCFLCHSTLYRFGVLTPQWHNLVDVTVCERLHWEREVNPEGTGQSLQQSIQFQNNANSSPEVADSSHNSQHPSRTTQCPIPALECVTINSADEDVGEHPSISDMFKLSQPLPSRKHSQVYIQEEINSDRISNPENLALNLDDENLFLPLSFQEFGYQTQNRI